jgi:uncharacterized membrane protein
MTTPSRTASLTAIGAAAVASAVAYPFLPSRVATRFDAEGRPTRYSSRMSAATLFPSMMLGIQLFNDRLGAWPGSHDRDDGGTGRQAQDEAIAITELGLLPAHLAILAHAAGIPVNMRVVNRGIYGVLLVALGNVLPKLPRNGLIGIRTPWTLADPAVWERTHRLGGYLVTIAGLASLASVPVTDRRIARLPTIASLGAIGLSAAYSFVAYSKRTRSSRG